MVSRQRKNGYAILAAAVATVGLASMASATTYYWDPTGASNMTANNASAWDTGTLDWSAAAAGGTPVAWTTGSDANFCAPNVAGSNVAYTVNVSGALNASSLNFQIGTPTLKGGTALTIGAGGIMTGGNSNNGGFFLDSTLGTVYLSASQYWSGNGNHNGTVGSAVASTAPGTTTLFLAPNSATVGSTTGYFFNGALADGSSTSVLAIDKVGNGTSYLNAVNTYSGFTAIEGGLLTVGTGGRLGTATAAIDLGFLGLNAAANFTSGNYLNQTSGSGGFLVGPRAGINLYANSAGNLVPGNLGAGGVTVPVDTNSTGMISVSGSSTQAIWTSALDMSSIGSGSMFLTGLGNYNGGITNNLEVYAATLAAGSNNTYRLGGGSQLGTNGAMASGYAGLTFTLGGTLIGPNALVVGMPLAGVANTPGVGYVNLNNNSATITQSYTGGTTVNQGSIVVAGGLTGSPSGSAFGSATAAITLNGGAVQINGQGTVHSTTIGDLNFNGGAALTMSVNNPSAVGLFSINGSNGLVRAANQQGVIQISAVGTNNVLGTNSKVLVTNNAPTVTSGMVAPYIQDNLGNFLTYTPGNGFALAPTVAFPTAGGSAGGNGNVLITAATALAPSATDTTVNSLVVRGNLTNSSGSNRTLNITSGGLSFNTNNASTIGSTLPGQAINLNFANAEAIIDTGGLGSIINGSIPNVISNTLTSYTAPALTKNGPSILTLGGANTFKGLVTINQGQIAINADSGLGDGGNGVVINGGALYFNTAIATNRTMTIGNGYGSVAPGVYTNSGAIFSSNRSVNTLNGLLTTGGAGTSAPFVDFGGGGGMTGGGATGGTFILTNNANDFTAPIIIDNGNTSNFGASLQFSSDAQLGNLSNSITLSAGTSGIGTTGLTATLA